MDMEQHERFMRIALEEAARSYREGNSAVGSIVVRDGDVIARGRNLVSTTHDVTAHAETVALREAGSRGENRIFRGMYALHDFRAVPNVLWSDTARRHFDVGRRSEIGARHRVVARIQRGGTH